MSNQKAIEGFLPMGIRSSSRFVSFIADRDERIIYTNPLFLNTYGISTDDILQKKLPNNLFIDNGLQQLTDAQKQAELNTDKVFEAETNTVTKEGHLISICWEVSSLYDNGGTFIGFLHIGENVSELLKATHNDALKDRMLNSVSQAIIATDIDCSITYWNRFAETLYGWKKEEILGKNLLDTIPAESSKPDASDILEQLKKGDTWQGELIMQDKNTNEFPAYIVNSPVFDEQGHLSGVIGTSFDVSKKKKTESILEENKEKLAILGLIADKTINAIVMSNPEGNIEWVNNGFTTIFGYTPEEVMGKRPGLLLRGKDSDPTVVETINAAIREKKNYDIEIINYRKNGEPCWIRIQGQPVFNDDGSLRGIIDITADITERKKHEEHLLFQAHLLDSILQAVIVVDLEGKVTFWNHFAEKLYGWTKQEAIGNNIMMLTPTDSSKEQAQEIINQLHNGNIWQGEYVVKHKDGSSFPVYVVNSPVYDKAGKVAGIIGVSFDITERKLAEEERKKSYSILLKQYKKLKQFAHINAHDLRAPLTNILSIASLVFHESELLPLHELKSYIRGLDNSAKQMDGVIRKLNSVLQGYQMDTYKDFFGSIAAELKKQVVLIDDDPVQNLINKKVIGNHYPNYEIIDYTNAEDALEDIKHRKISPDVVFLDLNMPFMDGWEFLEALKDLQAEFEVQILTSSIDQKDFEKARLNPKVSGINSKPLQKDLLDAML